MKIIFVLFLVLLFFFIPIKIVVGGFPNVYHFDFDPTLIEDNTLLRDHPQIKRILGPLSLIVKNNRIEHNFENSAWIKFDIIKASNFLELTIDAEKGFSIPYGYPFNFRYKDALGNYHLVTNISAPVIPYSGQAIKMHLQLKFENAQWFSRYKIIPQRLFWTDWRAENITNKNSINEIQIGFNIKPYLILNDIKVFSEPEGVPPSFSLYMYPYDKEGTTIVRTPNYVIDSLLATDFAIRSELGDGYCLMPPFNEMIDRIKLYMVDTKIPLRLRTITKHPLNLPYKIYFEPPAPEVPVFVQMQATMKDFEPSTWLLLGYKVYWKCGFYWRFPASERHTFTVLEEHLSPQPPELIETPKIPHIIPPILFPDLPPPEPRPPITEPLNRLIWHIEGFFRMIFFPSQDAINNLNYQVSRLQHRFPINYINETRRFFKNLTYTPTNPHPTALTIAFPVIGQEPIEIEIINFNWLNNPVYVFGTSTTIANLLKSLTSFFIVILFITFIIAIIKVIL